ncbi:endonuclease NucS [Candidatus Bathyarchaeota archaeon]|nr:endonuclease NucS [Candidatus Bathyarchaeota archaeon]
MINSEKFIVTKNPTLEDATAIIGKVLVNKKTLIIVGNFKVIYNGRASSNLEYGERILIVKSDGAILIHRSFGYEPVNWQPPGSILHVQKKSNILEISAIRHNPRETLKILFDKIFMISTFSLDDFADFNLFASEKDMHKAILLKPSLIEQGFKPISYEKKVDPGFIDVYGVDKNGKLVVIEVKRKIAGKYAVLQLAKYVTAIKRKSDRDVRGVLVAPNISKGIQHLLFSLELEFIALDPKKCANLLKKPKYKKQELFFNKTF